MFDFNGEPVTMTFTQKELSIIISGLAIAMAVAKQDGDEIREGAGGAIYKRFGDAMGLEDWKQDHVLKLAEEMLDV